MKIIHSNDHRLHAPRGELHGGELVPPFERPERVDYILRRLSDVGLNQISAPGAIDFAPIRRIHDGAFLAFLEGAWGEWLECGFNGDLIPCGFPARRMQQRVPDNIDGKAGYYAMALETAITSGTWQAAQASCAVVQSAQRLVANGDGPAFALCRPPGHHAAIDMYGGYCFLNNAAVAAQMFLDQGARRVAILDVDFHHGNGTQDIFYNRDDVLFCSLHGRPEDAFPYYLGYADETGAGRGEGANFNYPLPPGTTYPVWAGALEDACARILSFGAEALVVSLGVDTFKEDPISFFKLESEDFRDYGKRISRLGKPTLFVMEGGYAVEEIGINTVNVLQGFLD